MWGETETTGPPWLASAQAEQFSGYPRVGVVGGGPPYRWCRERPAGLSHSGRPEFRRQSSRLPSQMRQLEGTLPTTNAGRDWKKGREDSRTRTGGGGQMSTGNQFGGSGNNERRDADILAIGNTCRKGGLTITRGKKYNESRRNYRMMRGQNILISQQNYCLPLSRTNSCYTV